jgi:hypothetical protein
MFHNKTVEVILDGALKKPELEFGFLYNYFFANFSCQWFAILS